MRKFNSCFYILLIFIAFGPGALVQAQRMQVYVSAAGNDVNSCLRDSPCRTLARAMVPIPSSGGEVIVLDSGEYGPVTIDKSITIHAAEGVYAGVNAPGQKGSGITINAGVDDVIVLRGLTLSGESGGDAILFNKGGALHIENCVISGWGSRGINFAPIGDGASHLFVKDTIIRNNADVAIWIRSETGKTTASLDRCRLEQNVTGLLAGSNAIVTIRDSIAANNLTAGFGANPQAGATEVNLENCIATKNGAGLLAQSGGVMRASNTTIANNSTGLSSASGGKLLSYGNNKLAGNDVDGAFDDFIKIAGNPVGGGVKSVTAGAGLIGGGASGDVSVAIAGGGVTANLLADSAVSASKLTDGAVTSGKIASGQVVKTLNGLTDDVTLAAGANITLTPSGKTLTIATTGAGGVKGGGTTGKIAKWTGESALGDSAISESDGSVGIGTTSPLATLEVHGVGGSEQPGKVNTTATVNVFSSNFLLPQGYGQLGLFTTDPQGPDVGGQIVFGGQDGVTPLRSFAAIAGRKETNISDDRNGYLQFSVRSNVGPPARDLQERMRIISNGNVGIGTTSPNSKLTVNGVIESTSGGIKFPDGSVQTTAGGGLSVVAHDASLTGNGASDSPLAVAAGGIGPKQLADNAVTSAKIAQGQALKSLNGLTDGVILAAGPNVTITPNGNVLAIGALSGWSLSGNAGTNPLDQFLGTIDNQPLVFKTNNTEAMRLSADGNLAIGTTNAGLGGTARLTVAGDDIWNSSIGILNTGGGLEWRLGSTKDGSFILTKITGATFTPFTAHSNGNVEIATSGPTGSQAKLTVGGLIENLSGGIKFPDGTIQTTAAIGGLGAVTHDASLTGSGASGSPLAVAAGGIGSTQLADNSVISAKIAIGQVLKSLNGLTDNVTLTPGTNIKLTPSGNTLRIDSTGVGVSGGGGAGKVPKWSNGNSLVDTAMTELNGLLTIASPTVIEGVPSDNDEDSTTLTMAGTPSASRGPGVTIKNSQGKAIASFQARSAPGGGTTLTFRNTQTDGQTRTAMVVSGQGRMGVGTTNPRALFEANAGTSLLTMPVARFVGDVSDDSSSPEGQVAIETGSGNTRTARLVFTYNNNNTSQRSQMGGMQMTRTPSGGTSTTFIHKDASGQTREPMSFNERSYVGIGTRTPREQLEVNGTGVTRIRTNSDSNAGLRLAIKDQDQWSVATVEVPFGGTVGGVSRDFQIYNEPAGRNALYIQQGSLSISTGGSVSTTGNVSPINDNAYFLGTQVQRWRSVFATNGTIQTSDVRLKREITSLGYGLSEVMRLRPVTFKWKNGDDPQTHLGLIAQEVEQIIPESIEKGATPDAPMGMNYTSIVPVLIKAVQEQQAEIARRDAQINTLQQQLADLAARFKEIEQTLPKIAPVTSAARQ